MLGFLMVWTLLSLWWGVGVAYGEFFVYVSNASVRVSVPVGAKRASGSKLRGVVTNKLYSYNFIWWPRIEVYHPGRAVAVPLWMVLATAAIPTIWLGWRERGIPPGHCQTCGYNLTGNISGRCPECGTAIKPDANAGQSP